MMMIKHTLKLLAPKLLVLASAFTAAFTSQGALAASVLYDFNHLNAGALVGQDNWQTHNGGASIHLTTSNSLDGSLFAGTGDGAAARALSDFGLPEIGTAKQVVFGADMWSQDWTSTVGLFTGNDYNGGWIRFDFDDQRDQLRFRGGSFTDITLTASSFANTTWLRSRVVIDLTANNGAGSASVFLQDLLDTNATLTAVAGMQNINLGLTPGTGGDYDPASFTHTAISEGAGHNGIDNLYLDVTPTPITGPLSLMILVLAGLGLRRSRHPN